MAHQRKVVRDFPGKRWANLALRGVHLVGVVLFGAALLNNTDPQPGALILLISGLLMFAIDVWATPPLLREVAGVGIFIKLALLVVANLQPTLAVAVFWLILALSTLISHAPAAIRHRQLF